MVLARVRTQRARPGNGRGANTRGDGACSQAKSRVLVAVGPKIRRMTLSTDPRPGARVIWRLMLWIERDPAVRGPVASGIWVAAIAAGYWLAGCCEATIAGATWLTFLATGGVVVGAAFYAGDPPCEWPAKPAQHPARQQ